MRSLHFVLISEFPRLKFWPQDKETEESAASTMTPPENMFAPIRAIDFPLFIVTGPENVFAETRLISAVGASSIKVVPEAVTPETVTGEGFETIPLITRFA